MELETTKFVIVLREIFYHANKPGTLKHVTSTLKSMFRLAEVPSTRNVFIENENENINEKRNDCTALTHRSHIVFSSLNENDENDLKTVKANRVICSSYFHYFRILNENEVTTPIHTTFYKGKTGL